MKIFKAQITFIFPSHACFGFGVGNNGVCFCPNFFVFGIGNKGFALGVYSLGNGLGLNSILVRGMCMYLYLYLAYI